MLHLVNANVPFWHRRILIQGIAESNEPNRGHQICSEFLSSLSAKKELIQLRTCEGKSWTPACERENYGELHEDSKLPLPFLVNTRITECNSPVSREYKKEIATFESGAQAVCSEDNKEYILEKAIAQQPEKRHKLSDEPAEKKRKNDALEDDPTRNGQKERDSTSYWERRKRNNASAKRSRDARKAREMQTQIKAAFLERENLRIQAQLMIAQQENACLKRFLCSNM